MGIYTSTDVSIVNCKLTPNLYGAIYDDGNGVTTTFTGIVNDYEAVEGDLVYFNGTNWVRLAKGTANQYLKMNGTATAPIWVT